MWIDKDIVNVDKAKQKISQDLIHHSMECVPGVPESKGKAKEFEHSKWRDYHMGDMDT